MRVSLAIAGLLGLALAIPACGKTEEAIEIDEAAAWETLDLGVTPEAFDAKLPLLDSVPIDPKPIVGKDYEPEFPTDIPFDPSEWETSGYAPDVNDPRAKPGGMLKLAVIALPATIRTQGPNSASSVLTDMHNLVYERLLQFDATSMTYAPSLATHWQVLPDKITFRFRLDPEARWSDGRPVTSDDVVATIEHMKNPDRKDPSIVSYYSHMVEYVKALDRLTVEIKGRSPRWRTFLTLAAGTDILPAAYIRMDGETYLSEWNWRLPPGTGPYEIRPEDIRQARSITLRRRKDWWQQGRDWCKGMYNFDQVRFIVVKDRELIYTKFLAGELDIYFVGRAQRWVEELNDVEQIQMGWVQQRRIFNKDPQGHGGYVFNMRKPPFDDVNVRLAIAHLHNREKLMSSFFFYQYEYTDSYFPGQDFARPDAKRVPYDKEKARELLAKSGWVDKDEEGYLVNQRGERFPVLTLEYATPTFQRIHDVFRNELWNEAGIKLELKLLDSVALSKKIWEYKFTIGWMSWTGVLFPSLELSWLSDNADKPATRNLSGFKNDEVDEIITKYRVEFNAGKRKEMLQRVDKIIFDTHPYALGWNSPYFRILYWDKFGHPPEYAGRFTSDWNNLINFWWYDGERDRRTAENRRRNLPNYPDHDGGQTDDIDQKYWLFHTRPMKED